jgi:curved DNA-binding protein CbpA
MDFYTVLGISNDADEATIRSAYRMLVRRYHPDRGAGSSAEKFRQVNEAYATLIDPTSRRSYDLSLGWTEAQVPVRIEPMATPSGLFRQEDAGVFGRFTPAPEPFVFPNSIGFDEFLGRRLRSLDELFFDLEWPW